MKKYWIPVLIGVNTFIIAMGLVLDKNIFCLFPIAAVLVQTCALWLTDENHIRRGCIFGVQFWLVYNFASGTYSSFVGDVLGMASILIVLLRYDLERGKTGCTDVDSAEVK